MSYDDELEIVKSVYCRDGEFSQKVSGNALLKGFTLNLNESSGGSISGSKERRLCVSFYFPNNYPEKPPRIDVVLPKITKESSEKLNNELVHYASSRGLLSSNMMLEVIMWVRDNMPYAAIGAGSDDAPPCEICALRIDHMRAKKSYLKILQKWTIELSLSAAVVFIKHFIFVLLEGHKDGIQEFIKRLRSRKVDLDSSGHPCKERMMNILSRRPSTSPFIPDGFSLHEPCSLEDLEHLYESCDYRQVYRSVLRPVLP